MEVLFNFLLSIWESLFPFYALAPDQRGVQWRSLPGLGVLGRLFPKVFPKEGVWYWEVGPGVHWKFPLIDEYVAEVVKVRYRNIDNISCETKDKVPMMVSLSIKFWIHNIQKALLEVEDFQDSLVTDAQNIVVEWVEEHDYAEVSAKKIIEECYPMVREVAPDWGCKLRAIGVNSRVKHRLYRFLTE